MKMCLALFLAYFIGIYCGNRDSDLIPKAMDQKKYRYNHIGIPTNKKIKNERYLPKFDVYVGGYEENEFNIEWMRYGANSTVPEIVKSIPHVAFEVDDIYEAIKGKKIIIPPNSPSEGVIVAFVLINDAPVEFLQWVKKEK